LGGRGGGGNSPWPPGLASAASWGDLGASGDAPEPEPADPPLLILPGDPILMYVPNQPNASIEFEFDLEKDGTYRLDGVFMFGVMAIAAVGLTASQAWLAWEIWKEQGGSDMPVETLGVIIGLVLTFVLSTISGFMLGGNQPPAGQGLPIVGWHMFKDIRPAHFLGVHAQQLIPLWGLVAANFMGAFSNAGLLVGSVLYVLLWVVASWLGSYRSRSAVSAHSTLLL
jgi:hypothetical protein